MAPKRLAVQAASKETTTNDAEQEIAVSPTGQTKKKARATNIEEEDPFMASETPLPVCNGIKFEFFLFVSNKFA